MYILENKNITLRALEPDDLETLFEIENDRSLWQVSNTLVPFSRDILKKYISQAHQDIYEARQLRLAISPVGSTELIGLVDLFEFDPRHHRAGIGIIVKKTYQQKGIASQAVQLVLDYAFNQLNLHQIFAHIPSDNEHSRRLFENIGFTLSGTQKDWIRGNNGYLDVNLFQFINPEHA